VRRNIIVVMEPHSLPLQFASETGIVGLALLLGILGTGVAVCFAAVRRLDGDERTAATALSLAALAYLLHAFVDYDWDFVGLTGPTMIVVGLLVGAGRPPIRAARRPFAAAAAMLISVGLVYSAAAPWLASRMVDQAYAALDDGDFGRARAAVKDARALNPLSADPIRAEAAVAEGLRIRQRALDLHVEAVELQPENPALWYELARYEAEIGLRSAAIRHAQQAQRLDPLNPRLGPFLESLFNAP
jgi:tetratricopeptide (TPR) repeat protein